MPFRCGPDADVPWLDMPDDFTIEACVHPTILRVKPQRMDGEQVEVQVTVPTDSDSGIVVRHLCKLIEAHVGNEPDGGDGHDNVERGRILVLTCRCPRHEFIDVVGPVAVHLSVLLPDDQPYITSIVEI